MVPSRRQAPRRPVAMTNRDDDLTPKLGRIRARGLPRGPRYLHQVLRAVALAGGRAVKKASFFTGSRIGRGAGIGRVLAARDRLRGFRGRRVIVKSRIVKLSAHGLKAAQLHLRYLQRDGVQPDGSPGQLYDVATDHADGTAFLQRASGDRHQFRFIVSAEDGDQYEDLKPLVRRLLRQMEQDLETRLDWVAVDHHNTGHPHSHVVLRGRDDRDRDLIIARDYLSRGMRERAQAIVSLDLGPRTDREIAERLDSQVEQDRYTDLDRELQRRLGPDGLIGGRGLDARHWARLAGRLQKLRRLGLAEEIAPARWRLSPDLEPTLRRLGERGDVIKTLHRELRTAGVSKALPDLVIYDPASAGKPLIGRLVARGQDDELNGQHYLVIDGIDGRAHFVAIGEDAGVQPIPAGGLIEVLPRTMAARPADRIIAAVAGANGGLYDAERHRRFDPSASPDFIQAHVRRLEALRRLAGLSIRRPDGIWEIAADHLERAQRFEMRRGAVVVEVLTSRSPEQLVAADGATWIDAQLVAERPAAITEHGYGRTLRQAMASRQQWLIAQGLAWQTGDRVSFPADLTDRLRRRELARATALLEQELGRPSRPVWPGARVAGVYQRPVDLVSGRYALLVGDRDFSLVPWRSDLEKSLGRSVAGLVGTNGISWSLGRRRGGPAIS